MEDNNPKSESLDEKLQRLEWYKEALRKNGIREEYKENPSEYIMKDICAIMNGRSYRD